jgi:hypothetical protein
MIFSILVIPHRGEIKDLQWERNGVTIDTQRGCKSLNDKRVC